MRGLVSGDDTVTNIVQFVRHPTAANAVTNADILKNAHVTSGFRTKRASTDSLQEKK